MKRMAVIAMFLSVGAVSLDTAAAQSVATRVNAGGGLTMFRDASIDVFVHV